MNILTKICIVVVALASMVAAPVFINMATVPENYRSLFEKQKAEYGLLKTLAQGRAETIGALRAEAKQSVDTARSSRAKDLSTITRLNSKITSVTAEYQAEKKVLASIVAEQTKMAASLATQVDNNKALEAQLHASRQTQSKQQAAMIDLAAALRESKAACARLEKAIKVYRENAADLEAQIIELNRKLQEALKGGGTEDAKAAPRPDKPISASVTAAKDVFLSINVGSAHGVKKGMELIVYRGSTYVGMMRVEQVGVGSAAGTLITKVLAPQAGDKVASDLNQ
ncbi:MAG: hypothetical protein HN909_04840 [Phycisphaerales bacterium]|nr:hypothetical protein [Phycisphaerales bacterium]MBT7171078.1 hypothetical protein [Phycisphaerales bacterium]